MNRLKDGYVLVPNPFNSNQVSKVLLHPETIECIVFWTKNPSALMNRLQEMDELGYTYYFQFTITSYDKDIEGNIPDKQKILHIFQRLSEEIGREKVIWRYDPVLLTAKYNIGYHLELFSYFAESLCGYTNKCTISFINMYKKCVKNFKNISIDLIDDSIKKQLASNFSKVAKNFGISIESCAEMLLLSDFGVKPSKCIDDQLISDIVGRRIEAGKDKSQRLQCGCIKSIDIGSYNTCMHGCKYCYATYSKKSVIGNFGKHKISSPRLIDNLSGNEKIIERRVRYPGSDRPECLYSA